MAKQQQVGSHMACAPFVNFSWMKIWKRSRRVCWTKITIIYNLRNVYQTKDIQPWSESLKSVQVWVIEKSFNCALAHNSCKSTAENFDRHVTDVVSKLFSTRTLSAFPCCGCLRISSSWICGDDCWPVSESGTENILASDSSSESPRSDGFSWLVKIRADASVQLIKILNSLMDFSQGQNCWR